MSKTARTVLGVLAALGVAGATLGLLVYMSRAEPAPAVQTPTRPEPSPPAPEPPLEPTEDEPAAALEPLDDPPADQRIATRYPRPEGPSPADAARASKAAPPPPEDRQPPKLSVLAPRGHAVVMTPKLLLRVKSEPGAQVAVDEKALTENSPGLFAINLRLQTGRNKLSVTARDAAGNQSKAVVTATFIDPARFEKNKAGFVDLLEQLDEVRSAAAELDSRIADLVTRLDDPAHADRVSALSHELREIRSTRSQIEEEVGRAIQEIDSLLVDSK